MIWTKTCVLAYTWTTFPIFDSHAWNAADLLPDALKHPLAAALMTTSWFSRHVLLERWFLHADEKPLSPMQLATPVAA